MVTDSIKFLVAATFAITLVSLSSSSDVSADVAATATAVSGLQYCGGGPWTSFFANLVSIPCDHSNIDNCCYEHDRFVLSDTLLIS